MLRDYALSIPVTQGKWRYLIARFIYKRTGRTNFLAYELVHKIAPAGQGEWLYKSLRNLPLPRQQQCVLLKLAMQAEAPWNKLAHDLFHARLCQPSKK